MKQSVAAPPASISILDARRSGDWQRSTRSPAQFCSWRRNGPVLSPGKTCALMAAGFHGAIFAALASERHRAMADFDFKGMTVVITGEGRGSSLGVARRFGQEGAHVVIAGRDARIGANAADALCSDGLSASFVPLDV